ncbi:MULTISPECIES: RrF2 family transcriptional regulator [Tenacibaculum]|uniref:Rrf2 family transcriptional regulator n=1 Tax=Tenacibaculum aiptasiae TaxID=426481 RepID=A0A7J5APP2_9FLAO|nr:MULTISPECIES: Rrf2 family transcriptional regulator [Tenacibaculum]KAB1159530.1 Rrf2 family transcriptional regulator [Tenacibaculum aiptasiae]MCF2875856.1 Rrf2 family transcriptional regulator [Tenacibaculum sp. Cn5-1]MCF2935931.1 Rrf2 family transcriptional regulator [Tenacibaculum sp. Cn5-34]MCG7512492.1 Rrf2 family transcriptional regulator [Tenacibaculum sp. Cn5-46]
MLSNACKYAIRSVLYLAIHNEENSRVGVKKIAEELSVPQPFLAKLLQQLTKSKLVSSSKGPTGGFYLNELNFKNTVWDIIKSIDGTDKFDQCFMGLSSCDDKNPCPVHFTVAPFKKKLMDDFKDKTIREFTKEIKIKGRHISLKQLDVN